MENPLPLNAQLEDLANYFSGQKENILLLWRRAAEADPRLNTVSRLGKTDFEDNIPESLDVFIRQLRIPQPFTLEGSADDSTISNRAEDDEAKHAHEHGFHRWQEGYEIREVMLEWGHLHFVLIQLFNEYETNHPTVNREAMNWGRMALAGLLNGGFSQSVGEYYRLQQTEAQEIVNGLSQALQQVSHWEQQRGQALRQAVHDLRGNLSAVQATTSILSDVAGPEADITTQNSVFEILQRGTSTLYQMLTELLDLARLEAGQEESQVTSFDVGSLLSELCESNLSLAESKGLTLSPFGPPTMLVQGDATKIRRIAQNLLLNAINYTPQGGVTMRWSEAEPNQWVLDVEDTGPGISQSDANPAILRELIQSDETATKPNTELDIPARGEGVGLAIVKRLCGILDAEFEVISNLEVGAIFRVTFPRAYSK